MVPKDLNMGFQGLALIQGQIYNPAWYCLILFFVPGSQGPGGTGVKAVFFLYFMESEFSKCTLSFREQYEKLPMVCVYKDCLMYAYKHNIYSHLLSLQIYQPFMVK